MDNEKLQLEIGNRHKKIIFYYKIFLLIKTLSWNVFFPFGIGCFLSNFLLRGNRISMIVGMSCFLVTWIGWMLCGYVGNKVDRMSIKNLDDMAVYLEKTVEEIKRNFEEYAKQLKLKKNGQ